MKKTVVNGNIDHFAQKQVVLNIEASQVKWLAELKGQELTIEFKPYRKNRSQNQNSLLWALISEIDLAENGRPSEAGEMDIYANLIKMARISTATFTTIPEAYEEVKRRKLFRHIEVLSEGDTVTWRGYYGSSTFDTSEMNLLIETAKDYATKLGVYIGD